MDLWEIIGEDCVMALKVIGKKWDELVVMFLHTSLNIDLEARESGIHFNVMRLDQLWKN